MGLRGWLFAGTGLSLLAGYWLMFSDHAPVAFNAVEEDLSYAWFVPLFSLYVLWTERKRLRESVGEPSAAALLLLLPALFIGFLGIRGYQLRFEIVGFVGTLIALTGCFFGNRTMRRVLFPCLFLLFCIPLHSFLDVITIHLRMFAVSVSYGVLRGCGVDIVREGTMLMSPTGAFAIDVAEPCSGMRSLFAMMALTAGYGYFTLPTWPRRGLLFVLSLPIAIIGNVVRILSIVVVGLTCSAGLATGFYHDYSGYVVFLTAVALMVTAGKVIAASVGESSAVEAAAKRSPEWCADGTRVTLHPHLNATPLLAVILTIGTMAVQVRTNNPMLCEPPSRRLGELGGFKSEILAIGEAEKNVLPADTILDKRVYIAPDGNWYQVSMVIGGKSKSSIHRPELCLPSQGFQMLRPRPLEAGDTTWRAVSLARRERNALGFAYMFYNQDGFRTASHVSRIFRDVWDRSVRSRIDRWVMVTVCSSTDDDAALSRFLVRLREFMR